MSRTKLSQPLHTPLFVLAVFRSSQPLSVPLRTALLSTLVCINPNWFCNASMGNVVLGCPQPKRDNGRVLTPHLLSFFQLSCPHLSLVLKIRGEIGKDLLGSQRKLQLCSWCGTDHPERKKILPQAHSRGVCHNIANYSESRRQNLHIVIMEGTSEISIINAYILADIISSFLFFSSLQARDVSQKPKKLKASVFP